MRTPEQISAIKSTFGESRIFSNVLSDEKISVLLQHYRNYENKIVKSTGPIVAKVSEGDGIIDDVLELLRSEVGDFKVRYAHYFETDTPHIIHNDDDFNFPQCYKAFVLPLELEYYPLGGTDDPKLIIFDQSYFDGPAKFMNAEDTSDFPVFYNQFVTDYTNVHGTVADDFPSDTRTIIPHIKDEWLEGLSVQDVIPWEVGNILMFDSMKLHCASDFRLNGVRKKIALSIFTEI